MGFPGYHGMAGPDQAFLPAILRDAGYNTFAVGKWHLSPPTETSSAGPYRTWPLGRGFERYYGFMGGDTSQWFPDLVQDNTPIAPPAAPEDGYHLNADLADHAIQMIKDAHVAAPDKPFFLYYATGAGHAPHHVEPEWVEPYRGRFDQGWDAYRAEVFDRQVAAGVVPEPRPACPSATPTCPPGTTSTPTPAHVRPPDGGVRRVPHPDRPPRRPRASTSSTSLGELDDTIVVAVSDNGASAEGGPDGTFNESLFFNFVPERLEDNLQPLRRVGRRRHVPALLVGLDVGGHHAVPPLEARDLPGRRERAVHRVVAGRHRRPRGGPPPVRPRHRHPAHAARRGRHRPRPTSWPACRSSPIHGASLAASFADPDAPSPRTTQYFEMHGYRAIDHDGWRAVCPFAGPSLAEAASPGPRLPVHRADPRAARRDGPERVGAVRPHGPTRPRRPIWRPPSPSGCGR